MLCFWAIAQIVSVEYSFHFTQKCVLPFNDNLSQQSQLIVHLSITFMTEIYIIKKYYISSTHHMSWVIKYQQIIIGG